MALPPCPEGNKEFWNECKGTKNLPDGDKYVGEWKDGNAHGQGTHTHPTLGTYVGEWKDGKMHGQGTYIG
ncbi:hypothetical protein OAJ43_04375 [Nitrosomonadales bacterium]|nr:hypothetical protein [Nitrosomonadales bacterium]